MSNKILLVDDEEDILEFLEYNLKMEGFEVTKAINGKDALTKMESNPDLIILDVMMPEMDGYELCLEIRSIEKFKNIPIIFLTAKLGESDEIKGLDAGADDYIQKPISTKKLIARVKSNLRKLNVIHEDSLKDNITLGPISIDKEKYNITIDNKKVFFPKKEFEILTFLISKPSKVFPRSEILANVWGDDVFVVERTVDVHIRKIREKLGKYANMIETIKGIGYKIKEIE